MSNKCCFFVSYFLAFFLFINRLWCGGCTGSAMAESLTTQAAFQLHFGPHMCLTEQIHFILINEAVSHGLVSLALYVHKCNPIRIFTFQFCSCFTHSCYGDCELGFQFCLNEGDLPSITLSVTH